MDIEYNYKKTIKQIAEESGYDPKVVSNHFNRLGYNHSKDHNEYLHREIVNYFKKNPAATIKEAGEKFGIKSHNTILKYKDENYVYKEKSKRKDPNKIGSVLSVGNSDHIILHNILKLYLPNEATFSCDLTFGMGGFYKKGIRPPKYKFDKKYFGKRNGYQIESLDEAKKIKDASLKSVVIDPPSKVRSVKDGEEENIDNNRDKEIRNLDYFETLDEIFPSCEYLIDIASDKLKKKGIMVIKSPDFVLRNDPKATYEGRWVSDYIINYATGDDTFELIDKFILVMNGGIMTSTTRKNVSPKHAFYFVFRKN